MKRLILPAILALLFHGLLLGLDLPQRVPAKPKGIPVEIAIRQKPQDKETVKKETVPKPQPAPVQAEPIAEEKQPPAPPPPKPAVVKKTVVVKRPVPEPAEVKPAVVTKPEEPPPPSGPSPEETLPDLEPHTEPTAEVDAGNRNEKLEPETPTAGQAQIRLAVPAYQQNRQPNYPSRAKRRGLQGTVLLAVLVDTQGRVADLKVDSSSGHPILDQAALEAVKQWIFFPATENEVPLEMWVQVPILFQLN